MGKFKNYAVHFLKPKWGNHFIFYAQWMRGLRECKLVLSPGFYAKSNSKVMHFPLKLDIWKENSIL